MPQCMGQCGRPWWKLHFSWSIYPPWPFILSISLWLKGKSRIQSWSGRKASRNPPAIGHIRVNSCESASHSSPCWAQEQGNPEHRPPRSHGFSRTFATRITVTWQVSERHCQRVGSSFRRRKTNCTFYILHYMWVCTICWYPDDGVHVWNIWYLAFSRRHEMKCNSQSYLCFCNCRDKSTLLFHPLTYNLVLHFFTKHFSFNLLISSYVSMPRFSVNKLNIIISTMLLVQQLFTEGNKVK